MAASSAACLAVEVAGGGVVVVAGGGLGAVDAGAPLDDVEIELEDALLAEDEFGDGDERGLGALAEDGAAGSEEEVFDELLGDGGAAAEAACLPCRLRRRSPWRASRSRGAGRSARLRRR